MMCVLHSCCVPQPPPPPPRRRRHHGHRRCCVCASQVSTERPVTYIEQTLSSWVSGCEPGVGSLCRWAGRRSTRRALFWTARGRCACFGLALATARREMRFL
eukprot:5500451-Prymnesium_polylepis.2